MKKISIEQFFNKKIEAAKAAGYNFQLAKQYAGGGGDFFAWQVWRHIICADDHLSLLISLENIEAKPQDLQLNWLSFLKKEFGQVPPKESPPPVDSDPQLEPSRDNSTAAATKTAVKKKAAKKKSYFTPTKSRKK